MEFVNAYVRRYYVRITVSFGVRSEITVRIRIMAIVGIRFMIGIRVNIGLGLG